MNSSLGDGPFFDLYAFPRFSLLASSLLWAVSCNALRHVPTLLDPAQKLPANGPRG